MGGNYIVVGGLCCCIECGKLCVLIVGRECCMVCFGMGNFVVG